MIEFSPYLPSSWKEIQEEESDIACKKTIFSFLIPIRWAQQSIRALSSAPQKTSSETQNFAWTLAGLPGVFETCFGLLRIKLQKSYKWQWGGQETKVANRDYSQFKGT